jgi:outer membrane biosynthesis protein TonB
MRKPILNSLVSVLIALLLVATSLGTQRLGLYPEGLIRKIVIKHVMPEFPKGTPINSAQGLVVVAVVFDEEGKLSQAEVLEAPHPLIKQAVLDALKLWETEPRGSFFGLHQILWMVEF